MPQSLVLKLLTQSPIASVHTQGHALQQLFFHLIDIVDPELGHVLRRDQQNYSYALSALQPDAFPDSAVGQEMSPTAHSNGSPLPSDQQNLCFFPSVAAPTPASWQWDHERPLPEGCRCWWRITLLDDQLFDHLIFLWNQLQEEEFPLGNGAVKILSIADRLPGSQWASTCSYQDIYERASACDRDIHFEFVTPTAFEEQGRVTPLPTTQAVFDPLRKYWNHYSGLAFAPTILSSVVPADFDIQTEPICCHLRNACQTLIGCTGKISFRIENDGDPLTIKRINTLADFTRYCGVGAHTRFGWGVMRRVMSAPVVLYRPQIR